MKPVSPAAAYFAIIPGLTEAAREVGYALAVHGSMARDLDLIAVPWTEAAESAEALILRLLSATCHRGHLNPRSDTHDDKAQSNGDVGAIKPHGRRSWSIHFDNGLYLDVSVMPLAMRQGPQPNSPVGERAESEVGGGPPAGAAPAAAEALK